MEKLRNLIQAARLFFTPRWNPPPAQPLPVDPEAGAEAPTPGNHPPPGQNPASPRHVDEHRVAYRPVPADGVFPKTTEEWTRQGNTARSRVDQTRVITVSGEVVLPEQVRLRCICGGFENALHHCKFCGCGLCRLCVRRFSPPNGPELILCDRDYRRAIDSLDTWQLKPRRQA